MKQLHVLTLIIFTSFTAMATTIKTEIRIQASPEKVWAIFSDFKNYPTWNPFIKKIEGSVELGRHFKAYIEPPQSNGMTFKPKVLVYEPQKELRWIGRLLLPGIFDGEHYFQLIDNGDGSTTFVQGEKFKGILIPFFKKMLEVNTLQGFELMNLKLKELVEMTTA
jgi:hypothetical protein